ncbi:uncharacterized protein LOC135389098 [Ornithodoros turicata]|uniref:uncharacterized protein LOC135389098 n=1 Tax=Ornithodoros turicata TaxID=34597 RepID=UPI00313A4C56
MQEDLDAWDPLREEYNSVSFNCYTSGPGANLPLENLPPFSKQARQSKSRTLCVKNVPVQLTEVGLRHLFNCFGKVLSVRKLGPRREYPGKTVAFVDYGTTAEALDAIQMLCDKAPFHLKVNIAMSLQERRKIEQRQKDEMDGIYKQIQQAKAAIEPTRATQKPGIGRGKAPQHVFTLNDLKNIKVTLGQGVGQRSVKSSGSSTISSSSASFKTSYDYVADSDSSAGTGPRRVCFVCGKKADLRCSVCKVVYCSRECQVKDWPEHLKECLKKVGQKRTGKLENLSDSDTISKGDHVQSNGVPRAPSPKSTQGGQPVKSPQKPLSALTQHLAQKAKSEKTSPPPPKVVKLDEVKLPPGEKVEVTICHAACLDDIYLQLISSQAALGEMHHRLQGLCKEDSGYEPKEGDVCAAVFSGEWYRACVIQVLSTPGGCRVYFLDYGNDSTVALADMCALPLKCTDLPIQAVHCRLHDIRPKDGADKQILEELSRLLSTGLPLVAKLVKMSDDERHEVELFSNEGQSFSALLKAKGLINTPQKSQTKMEEVASILDQSPVGTKLELHVIVRAADCAWCTALDKEMQEIENELNATCPLVAGSVRKSFPVGEFVASQSLEDGCWYRACVIRASPTERWVRYLDYGNDEVNTAVVPLDLEQKRMVPRAVRLSGPVIASLKVGDVVFAKIMHNAEGKVTADIIDGKNEAARLGTCKLDQWHFGTDCFRGPGELREDGVRNGPRPSSATPPAQESFRAEELVPKVIHIPVRGVPEKKCNMGLSWKTSDVLFLHQESLMEGLATMMDKLHEWAKTTKASRSHYDVGDYVAAYSKDVNAWHRARVLSEKNADGAYVVLLVDFGNSESIPPSSLRYLPPQFADYAIFAHCVVLDGGVSPEDPRLEQMLNQEPFAAVQVGCRSGVPVVKLVRKNGTCITDVLSGAVKDAALSKSPKAPMSETNLIQSKSPKAPTPEASLHQSKSPKAPLPEARLIVPPCPVPEQSFQAVITSTDGRLYYIQPVLRSESLLRITTALQSPPAETLASCSPQDFVIARATDDGCWYRAQVVSLAAGGKKAEVLYVDYGNSEVVDREALKPLTSALSREPACALAVELDRVPALPPADVAVLVNEQMKIEVVGGNSEKLKVRMTTSDGDCINDILAPQNAPAEEVRFHIPEATLPAGRSEAVLADREGNTVYLHLTANVDLLESLLNEVNSSVPSTIPEVVSEGDAVSVRPSGEGLWHRGTVQSIGASGKVKVRLVDAGRVEEVSKDELRYLSGKLATLPALTVAVCLHGLLDLNDAMLEPLKDEAVMVEAVGNGSPPAVKLYNEAGECINDSLKRSADKRAAFQTATPQQAKLIPEHELPKGRTNVTIVTASSEAAVLTVMQTSLATELGTMMADLNAVVSTLPPARAIVPQTYMCAKYAADGLWYRARVTAKGKSGFVVCFVDFGNEEEVPANDLRALPETFLTIPLFLNKVAVAGVSKIHQDLCKDILEIPAWIEVVDHTKNPPCVNVLGEDGVILNSEFASS